MDHQALNDFRHRVLKGEKVPEEEVRAAIRFLADMRQGVASSTQTVETKAPRKSAAQAKADAKDLLGGLL